MSFCDIYAKKNLSALPFASFGNNGDILLYNHKNIHVIHQGKQLAFDAVEPDVSCRGSAAERGIM